MRSTTAKFAIGAAAALAGFLYQQRGFAAVTAFAAVSSLAAAGIAQFTLRQLSPAAMSNTPEGIHLQGNQEEN